MKSGSCVTGDILKNRAEHLQQVLFPRCTRWPHILHQCSDLSEITCFHWGLQGGSLTQEGVNITQVHHLTRNSLSALQRDFDLWQVDWHPESGGSCHFKPLQLEGSTCPMSPPPSSCDKLRAESSRQDSFSIVMETYSRIRDAIPVPVCSGLRVNNVWKCGG